MGSNICHQPFRILKKIKFLFFAALLITGVTIQSKAQEVGIRAGNMSGNNVAIDAVISLGNISRIHADMSFGGGGVGLDVLWNPLNSEIGYGNFSWYAGVGPSFFFGDPFRFGIAGEIGLEYAIRDVPITIGADYRPTFVIVEDTSFDAGGFGFNIRWRIGPNNS